MRTIAWLLPVGLLLAVIGGCSSSRFGLAKNDSPPSKSNDVDKVVYGNPWKREKKETPKPSEEMKAELAKVQKDMEAARAAANDVTPWLKNAAEAEGRGDLAAAKGLYHKILDKDPNNGEAHHRLAVIADQQQDARTADEHYLKALTINRRDADLLSDMGYSLYLRGKFPESESRLKEALEANPYHRGAQSNLGLVYGRQGKYDQALAAFRQAGTESEAQKNIAQLFPNGRPGSASDQGSNAALADNARRAAPPLPTDVDQRLGADVPFAEVMKRMQQERETAQRSRAAQPPNSMFGQGMNPNNGSAMVNAASPMNPAAGMPNGTSPNGAMVNGQNNSPVNWPPVATTAPPTFNPLGSANSAAPGQPGMNQAPHWGTPAPNTMVAAVPTNVAKPQDTNPFWTGNAGNNTLEPPLSPNLTGGPASNGFATNMNTAPNANSGAGMNPPVNNVWGTPVTPPTLGNAFPLQNLGGPGNDITPAGYVDPSNLNAARSHSSMSDAQRMAAQMAMSSGPGGLLPVVTPGPTAAALPGTNTTNGVGWAYGEMSGTNHRQVENAVWTNPDNQDRNAPNNNAAPVNPGPNAPWADWTSPAPATINWQEGANGNAAPTTPQWDPNRPAASPPPWNGGSNAGAAMNSQPNANVDTYRWDGTPVNATPGNRPPTDGFNTNRGNSTTISNWPHAPNRP